MPSITYWLTTAAESALSLFGIRAPYEQPAWTPLDHLPNQVEIRAYAPRTAAETPIEQDRDDQAFTRLFRYITGANQPSGDTGQAIAASGGGVGQAIAMTIPVERSSVDTLRFFLPRAVARAGPPPPTDPLVHLVDLPAEIVAARRFSGTSSRAEFARQDAILRAALAGSAWHPVGATVRLGYDPPFTPPALRRNEVMVKVVK